MIAKYILPWFGGTPAVWSTVQLFFQALLTGGYAYANWLISNPRRREGIHIILLCLSVAAMLALGLVWKSPITPDISWKPDADSLPVWEIFKVLAVAVGLPYFLLSTNSPLMQAWSHQTYPEKTAYRLYALSNLGSLLGLVTYPILIEPYLTLTWQGRVWSILYFVYAGLAAYGAIRSLRARRVSSMDASTGSMQGPEMTSRVSSPRPLVRDYALWIALAMTASVLLLATTSHITQEVAVIPFLWVLPLTMYLFSFIFAFSGERWYSRNFYLGLLFFSMLLYSWALGRPDGSLNVPVQLGIFSLALFAACMVCHGELYRLRPHADRLTKFYLMVSIGGALGGIIITFAAPVVFMGYWELPLGFALCWLLFLLVTIVRPSARRSRLGFVITNAVLLSAVVLSSIRAYQYILGDLNGSLISSRNFYGVVRVKTAGIPEDGTKRNLLVHGITVHGFQFTTADKGDLPTAYYTGTGGGGLAILNHPDRSNGMHVGVLGLGIGTLSAFGLPGDVYRFYEINPTVINLALGEGGYFSYLTDSQAEIEVISGDARLSLEQELASGGSQEYDILILDVFSSDSIPVHLLDKEAFEVYLERLQPDGILALHLTNQYLDLVPVAWTLADHFNLNRILIRDPGDKIAGFPSIWMLMARDPSLLADPDLQTRAEPMDGYVSNIRLWTDDYNNLFQILK
ncbi:MAG: ferrichrome ABC transporter permease [Chloroflexi bacterium]|nr:MAG: ferrichrome ABC transporter permease [Chloroflexota bacterium]